MPVVEGKEVLNQSGQNRSLVLGIIVHHLLGQHSLHSLVGRCTMAVDLLVDETIVVRDQLAIGNCGIVGGPLAEELHRVASDSVARVISHRVIILGSGAVVTLRRIGHVVGVAERTVVDGVLQTGKGLTTQEVVQRAVLHNENNNILDVRLQVLSGRRRVTNARLVGNSRRGSGEGQKADKSTRMHSGRLSFSILLKNLEAVAAQ